LTPSLLRSPAVKKDLIAIAVLRHLTAAEACGTPLKRRLHPLDAPGTVENDSSLTVQVLLLKEKNLAGSQAKRESARREFGGAAWKPCDHNRTTSSPKASGHPGPSARQIVSRSLSSYA
jgi:hypothetical protein